jgi:predicted ester cyclase
MTEIDRVLLYRHVINAISRGDTQVLDNILAPNLIDHNPVPMQSPGRDGFKEWMVAARRSFPDLWGRVEDVLVSGDFVIGRVTWRGTQRGSFVGLPPTQKQTTFDAIHIVRFEGPTIAEWWGVANLLAVVNQLGGKVILEDLKTVC